MKAELRAIGTFNSDGSLDIEMPDGAKHHLVLDGLVKALSETVIKDGVSSHSISIYYVGKANPVILEGQATSLAMYWLIDNGIDVVAIVKEK